MKNTSLASLVNSLKLHVKHKFSDLARNFSLPLEICVTLMVI